MSGRGVTPSPGPVGTASAPSSSSNGSVRSCVEVTTRRRQVAGHREAGQRRRARRARRARRRSRACRPHAPPTPVAHAHVVRRARVVEAADEPALDAHDLARVELDRVARDARARDRLVEADRRLQPRREPRVIDERVGRERLLEARDVERVERGEMVGIGECVAAVRVDLQRRRRPRPRRAPRRRPLTSCPGAIFSFRLR